LALAVGSADEAKEVIVDEAFALAFRLTDPVGKMALDELRH
jgi:hypothetical protein